ncbi:hypothetical protein AMK59_2861 [Oryctes borbonicus]|uniref:Uncharacterized protein n=1 Tax=Oryctes borbonicus TaxID=1629725 RepID=A0A0T6BHT6_9SCAR|nr:hypothetical protein AMK59_2861 [Oryctes borbonicus]
MVSALDSVDEITHRIRTVTITKELDGLTSTRIEDQVVTMIDVEPVIWGNAVGLILTVTVGVSLRPLKITLTFLVWIFIDRRPPYDDRPPYPEGPARTGYDDRRMPPASGFDERRLPLSERRPLMDPGMSQGPRGLPSSYDRSGAAADMFSRRDNATKPMERSSGYSPSGGYGSSAPSYGQSGSTASGYGGYGDSRGTGSMGYDSRTPAQSGGYGDSRGPSSYPDSRGPPPLGGSSSGGMYSESRGSGSGSAAYGVSSGTGAYGSTGVSAAYEGYGSSRSGAYDSAYPPLPQQRGLVPPG